MTREEREKAIDALKISAPVMAVTQEEFNDYIQTLNKIMNWLEQEPCEDTISRLAVLDLIEHYNSDGLGSVFYGYEQGVKFADAVNKLPPVTPAEKVGHWISNAEDDLKISEYTCSNCKGLSDEDSDFCPKCGSYNGGAV